MTKNDWMGCYFKEFCMFSIIVFHKLDKLGNNANIGIRYFATWKQIPVTKCYHSEYWTQWVLNPWTSDSKSNTLFSELIWMCYLGDL